MRHTVFALLALATFNTAASANPTACTLVTAAEMSEVLGATLTSEPDDRGGQTKCSYSPQEGFAPYAELQINWDDGKAGMAGAQAMGEQLKDVMNKFAGLGDEAAAVGPMILIRRGTDLITLVLSGVDDSAGKAKQIYAIVDGQLANLASGKANKP